MQPNTLLQGKNEVTPENLGDAIQQAIEIEIATIPVYLHTYYTINRTPNQANLITSMEASLVKAGKSASEATRIATECSAEIMVYANKAGAVIMSVAVEEMLHMSLSSNLKQALAGTPELMGKSPSVWPAYLAGHIPEFPIDLGPFSLKQLKTFLKIESPQELPKNDLRIKKAIDYTTIGKFYDMITECIKSHDFKYNKDKPQLIPGRGYYANNNVDTLYYNKEHKPQFTNAKDSGDLIHVTDRESALAAIELIVHQGEGHESATPLNPDGSVNCEKPTDADYDDAMHKELSHFEKFARLYCRYVNLEEKFAKLGLQEPGTYFVHNTAINPKDADFPEAVQKVSAFLNAVYSYIFLMSEECYRKDGNTQYEIFMFGIHKSMIWILNNLCNEMVKLNYIGPDGNSYVAAATFKEYTFTAASSPKSQVIDLFNQAAAVNGNIAYLKERLHDLPDVSLEPYLNGPKRTSLFS
ncbi:MAG: ferritin-like protein [Bacteroidia bacterium]|nr:ferritin-like protein [Bacteroidia bacterium]